MRSQTTTLSLPADTATQYTPAGKLGTRSDGVVAQAAVHRLRSCAYKLMLRSISCSECEGVLVLHGRVKTYYQKQQAQEVVRDIPDVREIINAIEVR